MNNLSRRVSALETGGGPFTGWHCVVQGVGQTLEQAMEAYELAHGKIGGEDYFVVRTGVPRGAGGAKFG